MEPTEVKAVAVKRAFYATLSERRQCTIQPTIFEEPADVWSYAKQFDEFPHDTTLGQFLSESQSQSYRGLGFYIMDTISSPEDGTSPPNLQTGFGNFRCDLRPS